MKKTILAKLKVEESERILKTFSAYKEAWQYISNHVFKTSCRDRKKIHEATYAEVRNLVPELNSALCQQARDAVLGAYRSAKSNGHILKVPAKLKNVSIRFDKRTASIKGNILSFCALGGRRIKAEIQDFPFLSKCRTYKCLAPLIFYKKGQFWVALTFDIPEKTAREGNIVGVDMGIRVFFATSEGKLYKAKNLNRLRRKTKFLKRELQRKGTQSARRKRKRIGDKEKRQSRNATHIAVNELLKTDASIFAVEELDLRAKKYRKSSNRRRFSVPLSEFIRILTYKGKLVGKSVVQVNPSFTSQDDCRGLERGERLGGKYIGVDGFIMHADINAACNIALRAKAFGLNNPASVVYFGGQAHVNEPNVLKSPEVGRPTSYAL